jgi:hypothetical protein
MKSEISYSGGRVASLVGGGSLRLWEIEQLEVLRW